MPVKFSFNESRLMMWLQCHQCYNLISRCEEVEFSKKGITPEQHAVLLAIKYISDPAKPSHIARYLDRRSNNISLITERMEKNGLIRRTRDLLDRRSVRLALTKKGENILDKANVSRWNLVRDILSDFSEDELQTLSRLMEKIRERAFGRLQPGDVMEEIKISKSKNESMSRFLSRVN